MSFITTLESDVAKVKIDFNKVVTWWEGTPLGEQIDADFKLVKSEIESVSLADAKKAGMTIATAALSGWATGGTAGAFEAGVAAAIPAFKAAGADISAKTANYISTTVLTQIQASKAV